MLLAPHVAEEIILWRPIMSEPPLYTLKDLREWVALDDVFDAHEALNLKEAMAEKVRRQSGR